MLFNGGHNIPHPKDISIFQQNAYVIDSTTMGLLNISRLNPRNNISFNAQPDDYQTQINQIEISAIERQYSKWVYVFRNVQILTKICYVKILHFRLANRSSFFLLPSLESNTFVSKNHNFKIFGKICSQVDDRLYARIMPSKSVHFWA